MKKTTNRYPYALFYTRLGTWGIYYFQASGKKEARNKSDAFIQKQRRKGKSSIMAYGLLKLVDCYGDSAREVLNNIGGRGCEIIVGF